MIETSLTSSFHSSQTKALSNKASNKSSNLSDKSSSTALGQFKGFFARTGVFAGVLLGSLAAVTLSQSAFAADAPTTESSPAPVETLPDLSLLTTAEGGQADPSAAEHPWRVSLSAGGSFIDASASKSFIYTPVDDTVVVNARALATLNWEPSMHSASYHFAADWHGFVHSSDGVNLAAGLLTTFSQASKTETKLVEKNLPAEDNLARAAGAGEKSLVRYSYPETNTTQANVLFVGLSLFAQLDPIWKVKPYLQFSGGLTFGLFNASQQVDEVAFKELKDQAQAAGQVYPDFPSRRYAEQYFKQREIRTKKTGYGFYGALGFDFMKYFSVKGFIQWNNYFADAPVTYKAASDNDANNDAALTLVKSGDKVEVTTSAPQVWQFGLAAGVRY